MNAKTFIVAALLLLVPQFYLLAQEWSTLADSLSKVFGEINNVSFNSTEIYFEPTSAKDFKVVGGSKLKFRASRMGYFYTLSSENSKNASSSTIEEAYDGETLQLLMNDRLTIQKRAINNSRLHDKIFLLMPFDFVSQKNSKRNDNISAPTFLETLTSKDSWRITPLDFSVDQQSGQVRAAFGASDPMLDLNCDSPVDFQVIFHSNNLIFPVNWSKSCKSTKESRSMSLECSVKDSATVSLGGKVIQIPKEIEMLRKINGYVYSKTMMSISDCVFNRPDFDEDFMIDPSRARLIEDVDQKLIISTPK